MSSLEATVWPLANLNLDIELVLMYILCCSVVGKELVERQGLFNPYTFATTIVVNGVAASSHSEWILDPLFDLIGRPDLLPTVYEVRMYSERVLCQGTSCMHAANVLFFKQYPNMVQIYQMLLNYQA